MSTEEKIIILLQNEKLRKFCAFYWYVFSIIVFSGLIDLLFSILIISFSIFFPITTAILIVKDINSKKQPKDAITKNQNNNKSILKLFALFIPIYIIKILITSFIMNGTSQNEKVIEEFFLNNPIRGLIIIVFIGPIIEEMCFRYLPYKFINNKYVYIIVSSIIFAIMHVISDPNGFYYFWFYMITPIYYAYCYHKTQKIFVSYTMHAFNNLICLITIILQ